MGIVFNERVKRELSSLKVAAVYLFGSRAIGAAGPFSDFDFAVLMEKPGSVRGDRTYDALYRLFSPLCSRTLENDVIDIVFLHAAPLELRFHVIRYGIVLFDGKPMARGRFETKTMMEYYDFRPILDQMDRAILFSL